MKTAVYIDGREGTTGLRIQERFQGRDDIELMLIDPELRKDPQERRKLINESDITFLCLPDAAAREAVGLVENDHVRIIDSSTAHRTESGWSYGFPELSRQHRESIRNSSRIAVPGCHATGLISLLYPLIKSGVMPTDYPVSSFSLTGYSGGGRKMIAEYEAQERDVQLESPREYALSQNHKHLKEMKVVCGLDYEPLFSPIVSDYYSGMVVSLPVYARLLNKKLGPEQLRELYAQWYDGERFISVMPFGQEQEMRGYLSGNGRSGWDGLEIYVTGNEERLLVSSRFDNLGKGASGAAVQCMNIMTGCAEEKGLQL